MSEWTVHRDDCTAPRVVTTVTVHDICTILTVHCNQCCAGCVCVCVSVYVCVCVRPTAVACPSFPNDVHSACHPGSSVQRRSFNVLLGIKPDDARSVEHGTHPHHPQPEPEPEPDAAVLERRATSDGR